ncbi:MAG: hypothetical protein IPN75_19295 [Dechloromonas sp.]|uniref:Uncharacterized protein n=1 Tax=Candidatus Dechloromonas phosphorivorans TaxID=2899244 RepID=A0A9D7LQE7_9RHOO|nr:hypothetical protein [Candidatus Dechloromonas phosphorivorans]
MSCAAWVAQDDPSRGSVVVQDPRTPDRPQHGEQSQQLSSISSATIENFVNQSYFTQKLGGQFSDAAFRLSDQFSGRNQPIKK